MQERLQQQQRLGGVTDRVDRRVRRRVRRVAVLGGGERAQEDEGGQSKV